MVSTQTASALPTNRQSRKTGQQGMQGTIIIGGSLAWGVLILYLRGRGLL